MALHGDFTWFKAMGWALHKFKAVGWDLKGVKLSHEGQFTCSVQFFLFLTFFFSTFFFLFEPPFLFSFLPPLLTQVFFWDLLPTYLPTYLPPFLLPTHLPLSCY
jgi:hypothetical protein